MKVDLLFFTLLSCAFANPGLPLSQKRNLELRTARDEMMNFIFAIDRAFEEEEEMKKFWSQ